MKNSILFLLSFLLLSTAIAQTPYLIDYDGYDEINAGINGQTYHRYIWNLNTTTAPSFGNSRWAIVDFDDLVVSSNGGTSFTTLPSQGNYTIILDSVYLYYNYQSNGGSNLVNFQVFNYNDVSRTNGIPNETANPVSGATPVYTNIKTQNDLVSSTQVNVLRYYPFVSFNPGEFFSIYITNQSDTLDQFSLLAGYKENCADAELGLESIVPNNSTTYTYLGATNGFLTPNRYIFGQSLSCPRYLIQNIVVTPFIRVISNTFTVSINNTQTSNLTCPGSTFLLDPVVTGGSGNYSYSWSPSTNLSNPNTLNPQVTVGNNSVTYTLTVTDLSNNDTETASISVVSNAISVNAGNNQSVTCGDVVTLNAIASGSTSGATYQWSGNVNNPNSSTTTATVQSTTTYTVTVTNNATCSATDQVTVSCSGNSGYNIDDFNLVNTCSGDFYDSGGPNFSYGDNESNSITFTSSIAGQQIRVSFISFSTESCCDFLEIFDGPNQFSQSVGSYSGSSFPPTVTSTNGSLTFLFQSDGSVTDAGWSAIISCVTTPLFVSTNDESICVGESVQLNANAFGGTGNYTYSWSPSGSLSNSGISNPIASPITTTNYTVTVSDGNTTGTATATVTVSDPPIVDAGPDVYLQNCFGSTTVTATVTGNYDYAYWGDGTSGLTNSLLPGQHIITVVSFTGCSASDVINVYVAGNQVVSFSAPSAGCVNDAITFTNTSNKISGWVWNWNFGDGNTATGSSANHTFTSTNQYLVTLTGDSANCSLTYSQYVDVNNCNNNLQVNISGNTNVCSGASTLLTATVTGGNGNYSYDWTPNPIGNNSGQSYSVSPSVTTVYSVYVTDGVNSTVKSITVNVLSSPSVNAGEDRYICPGSEAPLYVSSGSNSVLWQPSTGLSCTTCDDPVANPSSTTTYNVTLTNSNGCTGSDNITVNVSQTAPATVSIVSQSGPDICAGSTIQLSALITNGGNNPQVNWKLNGNPTATGTQYSGSFSLGDLISVDVVSSLGCAVPKEASNSVVVGSVCSGIDDVSFSENDLKVYPNPNSGNFIVSFENENIQTPATLRFFSVDGRLVSEHRLNDKTILSAPYEVNIDHFSGLLLMKLSNKDFQIVKRITILK